jgi:serine/threonine protein kinase
MPNAVLKSVPPIEIDLDAMRNTGEIQADLPTLHRFAGYEILGRIAVGGMAEVFLARERGEAGSVRQIALKVVRPQLASDREFAEMFLREGKVAMGLRHPNVCHIYRFGMVKGYPFLAMELVHGVTLRDVLGRARRQQAPLAPAIAAKIASSAAEALHSAHIARDERGRPLGLVHQDVSPHNVMVAYDGTVKLLDFGVASTNQERSVDSSEISQTMIRGKAGYLSPEQCTGGSIDARADVFSLGIVLWEMLTASRLFMRAQSIETMRAIATEPLPAWPESIPVGLRPVLERALARHPDERYRTAAAMQEDLESYLAESRSAVTSAKIAESIARLLGDDFGLPPKIDGSRESVAWLRENAPLSMPPPPAAAATSAPPVPMEPERSASSKLLRRMGIITLGCFAIAGMTAALSFALQIMSPAPSASTSEVAATAPVGSPAASDVAADEALPSVGAAPGDTTAPVEAVALAQAAASADTQLGSADPATSRHEDTDESSTDDDDDLDRSQRSDRRSRSRSSRRAASAAAAEAPTPTPTATGEFIDDPGF